MLRSIPIPLFPSEVGAGISQLRRIEQDMRTRADQVESMRLSVFNAESPQDLGQRLVRMRSLALVYSRSLQQAETLDFQVRNFYPFPLAYTYRMLAGRTILQDLYRYQLQVAEDTLALLASLALALLSEEDRGKIQPKTGVTPEKPLQSYLQRGITFGDWFSLFSQSGRILRSYNGNQLADNLGDLLGKKRDNRRFGQRYEELISDRNRYAHGRGPTTEEEYQQATERVSSTLDSVIQDLGFLAEYPIRLVHSVTAIRGTTRVRLETLSYMGDHPALQQEQMTYPQALTNQWC